MPVDPDPLTGTRVLIKKIHPRSAPHVSVNRAQSHALSKAKGVSARRAFGDYKPWVIFVCLMSSACIAMFSMNPIIALISFIGAAALWLVRSEATGIRTHLFYIILLIVLPLVNVLFSH